MDDVLVYSGNLERSPDKKYFASSQTSSEDRWRQRLSNGRGAGGMDLSQAILFTNDPFITQAEVIWYSG